MASEADARKLTESGYARMTPTPVHAIIFDMDGLLVDSEPLWRIAEIETLSAVGVPITEEDAVQTTGLRTDEVVELWYARYPWPEPPKKAIEARIITRLIALARERGNSCQAFARRWKPSLALAIPWLSPRHRRARSSRPCWILSALRHISRWR